MRETSIDDAKRWFLQILRCLRCSYSLNCTVIATQGFTTNAEEKELVLKVNCTGMYFFLPDQADDPSMDDHDELIFPFEIIDLFQLGYCELRRNSTIHMKAVVRGKQKEFQMKTTNGRELMDAVNVHVTQKERAAFLEKYSKTHSHPVMDSNVETETESDRGEAPPPNPSPEMVTQETTSRCSHPSGEDSQEGNSEIGPLNEEQDSRRSEDK